MVASQRRPRESENRGVKLLTVRQVSQMLAMSPATILRWVESGKLRALKLGTTKQARIRIPYDWLCEDVGYVSSSSSRRVSEASIERGYQAAMAELGLPPQPPRGHL